MGTVTTVVTGHVGDSLSSDSTATVDERFKSAFDIPVKLQHNHFVASSTVVTNMAGTVTYTEGDDYTIDNSGGFITVLSTGIMLNATYYLIDYSYNDQHLAYKINVVTSAANAAGKAIRKVSMTERGRQGVAVIVVES